MLDDSQIGRIAGQNTQHSQMCANHNIQEENIFLCVKMKKLLDTTLFIIFQY